MESHISVGAKRWAVSQDTYRNRHSRSGVVILAISKASPNILVYRSFLQLNPALRLNFMCCDFMDSLISQFAARQIGFEDEKECPNLGKLAIDYLKKTKKCEENIYTYFRSNHHPDVESICIKLIEELDKCILGYFGFHWSHTNDTITKVEEKARGGEKIACFWVFA